MKARPLDNIEFMQWFKAYWDSRTGGGNERHLGGYDARARRAASKTGDVRGGGGGAAASTSSSGTGLLAPPLPSVSSRAPLASRENNGARPAAPAPSRAAAAPRQQRQQQQRRHRQQRRDGGPPLPPPPLPFDLAAATATRQSPSSRRAGRGQDPRRGRRAGARLLLRQAAGRRAALRRPGLRCSEEEAEAAGRPVGGTASRGGAETGGRVLFAADEAGAKEVLAEAGVVGATGVTPPPPDEGEVVADGREEGSRAGGCCLK